MIRTVTTMGRKILAAAALPARFWPFAVHHAAYLYNAMAHSAFEYQFSPHAAFYGTPPRFHHLHPFGILMSYKILPIPSTKNFISAAAPSSLLSLVHSPPPTDHMTMNLLKQKLVDGSDRRPSGTSSVHWSANRPSRRGGTGFRLRGSPRAPCV